jgi:hypothetical protein
VCIYSLFLMLQRTAIMHLKNMLQLWSYRLCETAWLCWLLCMLNSKNLLCYLCFILNLLFLMGSCFRFWFSGSDVICSGKSCYSFCFSVELLYMTTN